MRNLHTSINRIQLATLLFCAPLLQAQTEETIEMAPFEVSAYRFDAPAIEVPTNATLITAEDIRRQGAFTLAEVLEHQAGVNIRSTSGDPAQAILSMRGFGEGSGSRVLVLVDGKRLNRPDLGRTELETIPMQAIESVEVLRGSWTTLYGDHAVGGVIKITTRDGLDSEGGALSLQGGSYGRLAARASYWNAVGDVDFGLNTEYNQNGGYRENSRSQDRTVHGHLGYQFNQLWDIQFEATYKNNDTELPGSLTEAEFRADPRQSEEVNDGVGDDNFSETDYYAASGTLTYDTQDSLTVALEGGWQLRDVFASFHDVGDFGPFISSSDNQLTTLNLTPKATWQAADYSVIAGIDFFRDQMDVEADNNFLLQPAFSDVARRSVAAFVYGQYDLADNAFISGGVRIEDNRLRIDSDSAGFTEEETLSNSNYAGQLGVTFLPVENLRLWARYDRVYRYPSTDEVAAYQGFALSDVFNTDLDPERGHGFEVGTGYTQGKLEASVAFFYQHLTGEIAFDSVNFLNTNLNDTRRLGVEASGRYRMDTVSVGLNYTGIDTQVTEGPTEDNKIPLVPWHKLSLFGEWEVIERVTLRGDLVYTSRQVSGGDFANANARMEAYTLLDLLVSWEPIDGVRLFVAVDNVLDSNYSSFIIRDPFTTAFYPAIDRNVRGGLNYTF